MFCLYDIFYCLLCYPMLFYCYRYHFPTSKYVIGQAGVYTALDDFWLEYASGHFELQCIPSTTAPQIRLVLVGNKARDKSTKGAHTKEKKRKSSKKDGVDDDSTRATAANTINKDDKADTSHTNSSSSSSRSHRHHHHHHHSSGNNKSKEEDDGITLRFKLDAFKLAGDRGKGVPKLSLESVKVTATVRVHINLVFNTQLGTWNAAPPVDNGTEGETTGATKATTGFGSKGFLIELLSFRGPMGLRRGMVSATLAVIIPTLKNQILSVLPAELGYLLKTLPSPIIIQGDFSATGLLLSDVTCPFDRIGLSEGEQTTNSSTSTSSLSTATTGSKLDRMTAKLTAARIAGTDTASASVGSVAATAATAATSDHMGATPTTTSSSSSSHVLPTSPATNPYHSPAAAAAAIDSKDRKQRQQQFSYSLLNAECAAAGLVMQPNPFLNYSYEQLDMFRYLVRALDKGGKPLRTLEEFLNYRKLGDHSPVEWELLMDLWHTAVRIYCERVNEQREKLWLMERQGQQVSSDRSAVVASTTTRSDGIAAEQSSPSPTLILTSQQASPSPGMTGSHSPTLPAAGGVVVTAVDGISSFRPLPSTPTPPPPPPQPHHSSAGAAAGDGDGDGDGVAATLRPAPMPMQRRSSLGQFFSATTSLFSGGNNGIKDKNRGNNSSSIPAPAASTASMSPSTHAAVTSIATPPSTPKPPITIHTSMTTLPESAAPFTPSTSSSSSIAAATDYRPITIDIKDFITATDLIIKKPIKLEYTLNVSLKSANVVYHNYAIHMHLFV